MLFNTARYKAIEQYLSSNDKIHSLLRRSVGVLTFDDICSLLKDHGYSIEINTIIDAIFVVSDKIKNNKYKEEAINNDLLNYRASMLLNAAKYRAEQKGYLCTIDREWVKERLEKGVCEATGLPLILTKYKTNETTQGTDNDNTNPYAPSIDRRDNTKGYTKENSQVVIIAYNKFKSDYKEKEVLKIAKALIEHNSKTMIEESCEIV